jgi:hypothetical protein
MRTKFTLLAALMVAFFSVNAQQQVPNPGFDTWTDVKNPDGWATWESAFGTPLGVTSRDSVDKILGSASVKIKTDSIQAGPTKRLIAGFVSTGTGSYSPPPNGPGLVLSGTPFTSRPDSIYFFFKYTPAASSTDSAFVALEISGSGSTTLLAGSLNLPSTNGSWALVGVGLGLPAGTPDSLLLSFHSSIPGTTGTAGSVLNVDGVLFTYNQLPNALREIADKLNVRIYPNPTTDAITVATAENAEGFSAIVTDISGRFVSATQLAGTQTVINVSELASGTYVYRIADKAGNVLKQDKFNVIK